MADPAFDRRRFESLLTTRRLGHVLIARAETASTNDDAFDALAQGLGDGVTVAADRQTQGRGRAGRTWSHAPGLGLALSSALHLGCDVRQMTAVPLAAGLALAAGLERLGARPELKWPNDLLLGGRKVAGILCEIRRDASGSDAAVIGVGVNVRQQREDFAGELASTATSLRIEGHDVLIEDVAAHFLNALEPWWDELQEGDRAALLAAWTKRATFWGRPVTVRTPAGDVSGEARRLDADGALVLALADGRELTVTAGDLVLDPARVEPA